MLQAFRVNNTEARQIALETGYRVPRNFSVADIDRLLEDPSSTPYYKPTQVKLREVVHAHCQDNWDILQEVLRCQGNCSSTLNLCTDTQASVCYYSNRRFFDRS